jgi:hypothetical protein
MKGPVTPEAQVLVLSFHHNIIRNQPSSILKITTVYYKQRYCQITLNQI